MFRTKYTSGFRVLRVVSTVILLVLALTAWILASRSGARVAFAVPILTSTKVDLLQIDDDSDSVTDPGDTLRYTVTITNSGTTDAANVTFSDTIDANTTLLPGSVKTSPIARHDSYAALGNVSIVVPAGSGVLDNDNDPDGGALSVTAFDAASVNGGEVSVAADGSFTYNPPPGYEGIDSFTYTVTDDEAQTDPATVTITVNDMIWFVDASATCPCDGRLSNPFTDLAVTPDSLDLNASDEAGDNIFLASGAYIGGLTLLDAQRLIGDGSSSTLAALTGVTEPPFSETLPTFSGTDPVITSTLNGITLGSNNTLRGLTIGDTPNGTGLVGTSVATLTIDEASISGAGGALNIDGGTLAVTLQSVSASNFSTGILVHNTSGSFSVTGTGSTDGSGGVISNMTHRGASFINATNIDLHNMTFFNASLHNSIGVCNALDNTYCNAAIHLEDTTGVDLTNVDISYSAQQGINGLDVTDFSLVDSTISECGDAINEGCLRMVNLAGTAAITNSDLSFPAERVAWIENTSGTLTLTVTDSVFRDTQSSPDGADGLEINSGGTSITTIDIVDSSFLRNRTNGLQVFSEDTATVSLDVTGSTFDRVPGVGIGMDLGADNTATFNFNVINNPLINGRNGNAVNVFADGNAAVQGRINNNAAIQVGGPGTNGYGIRVQANNEADVKVEIVGNTISYIGWDTGIQVVSRLGGEFTYGQLDATISDNTILVDSSSTYDIEARAQNYNKVCANVTNNTASGFTFVAFRARTSDADSELILQGSGETATAVWDGNGNTPTGLVSSSHNGTLTLGGTCSTVTHPTASIAPAGSLAMPKPHISTASTDQWMLIPTAGLDLGSLLARVRSSVEQLAANLSAELAPATAHASGENINLPLGTLNPGQIVTITFDVTVDSPFPLHTPEVCNQGLFTSDTVADVFTDDPDVGGAADPTCTPVSLEDQFTIFLPLIAR